MNKTLIGAALVGLLSGCGHLPFSDNTSTHQQKLAAILEQQSEATQARYVYRNPQETLTFFEIEPGMRVVEFLPGGGWYSQLLVPYLGTEGELIGVDYPMGMFSLFDFATPEFLQQRRQWGQQWTANREAWGGEHAAHMRAYAVDTLPASLHGQVDAVLFIRALHNLARFESEGGFLTETMRTTFDLLKPGGIVGVVQHAGPETNSDEWASGANGYLKESFIKEQFERAGFEFAGSSPVNSNPKDVPGESDAVWRLPPSLGTSQDDPQLQAQYQTIGETNRMTLKFRKPSQ